MAHSLCCDPEQDTFWTLGSLQFPPMSQEQVLRFRSCQRAVSSRRPSSFVGVTRFSRESSGLAAIRLLFGSFCVLSSVHIDVGLAGPNLHADHVSFRCLPSRSLSLCLQLAQMAPSLPKPVQETIKHKQAAAQV
jgi:hypothetical protein